jgi:hypothetical protein
VRLRSELINSAAMEGEGATDGDQICDEFLKIR